MMIRTWKVWAGNSQKSLCKGRQRGKTSHLLIRRSWVQFPASCSLHVEVSLGKMLNISLHLVAAPSLLLTKNYVKLCSLFLFITLVFIEDLLLWFISCGCFWPQKATFINKKSFWKQLWTTGPAPNSRQTELACGYTRRAKSRAKIRISLIATVCLLATTSLRVSLAINKLQAHFKFYFLQKKKKSNPFLEEERCCMLTLT